MNKKSINSKNARAISQLYRDAIANFIQADSDPKAQAEQKRIVQQLEAHAEHWGRHTK